MRRLIPTCMAVLLCTAIARADDKAPETSPLDAPVKAWADADSDDARTAAALQILMQSPDAADLATALDAAFAPPKDAPTAKPVTWKYTTDAGEEHTMFAVAPPSYEPGTPMPLLVWLHGGVSRDADGGGAGALRNLAQFAIQNNVLLLTPSGRNGAVWWDEAGVTMLRATLREMGRRYNVDRNQIAIGGFSDGASGCYHLLVADPTPYCCFLALAGQPGVPRLMGGPTHIPNLGSRPMYATHGGKDQLYPTERMQPMIDALKAVGARIEWQGFPDDEHNWAAVTPRFDEMLEFWKKNARTATPKTVTWQTARPALYGRFEWVEIVRIDPKAPGSTDINPTVIPLILPKPRARLGIRLDTKYQGKGLKVEEVQAGTAAEEAGMEVGDIVVKVDDEAIESAADLRKLGAILKALGDEKRDGTFVIQRGDEELELKIQPRPVAGDTPTPHASHKLPLGVVRATVGEGNVIDVVTNGVAQFKLHLDPTIVDFAKPLIVNVNGKERVNRVVKPDVGYMLTEAHAKGFTPSTRAVLLLTP